MPLDDPALLDSGFAPPKLRQLIDDNAAQIQAQLPGTLLTRRSRLGVFNRILSACTIWVYDFQKYLSRMYMGDMATGPFLARWSSFWGIFRLDAGKASGTILTAGDNGTVIPAGTRWASTDRIEIESLADVTIASGTATISVRAVAAGADGNLGLGTRVRAASPVAGMAYEAVVSGADMSGGADTESDARLRARLLDRIRQPPHGGAAFDYVKWAKEVPGVTRAWCFPLEMGIGTVTVRFVADDEADPIPGSDLVDAVQAYIEERRPVTAEIFVVAPVPVELDFTIQLRIDTGQAVRDTVEANLRDLLLREAEPGGTILISRVREAISTAFGERDHVLTVPDDDVEHAAGEMAVFGEITWVS